MNVLPWTFLAFSSFFLLISLLTSDRGRVVSLKEWEGGREEDLRENGKAEAVEGQIAHTKWIYPTNGRVAEQRMRNGTFPGQLVAVNWGCIMFVTMNTLLHHQTEQQVTRPTIIQSKTALPDWTVTTCTLIEHLRTSTFHILSLCSPSHAPFSFYSTLFLPSPFLPISLLIVFSPDITFLFPILFMCENCALPQGILWQERQEIVEMQLEKRQKGAQKSEERMKLLLRQLFIEAKCILMMPWCNPFRG